MSFSGLPTLGTNVRITANNLAGTPISGLMIGSASPPIPLSLIGSTVPGATLCVSEWLSVARPGNALGTAWFDLPITSDPIWCGRSLQVQWLDYAGVGIDIGTSQAFRLTVGP